MEAYGVIDENDQESFSLYTILLVTKHINGVTEAKLCGHEKNK